jgi:hypothetical protein
VRHHAPHRIATISHSAVSRLRRMTGCLVVGAILYDGAISIGRSSGLPR